MKLRTTVLFASALASAILFGGLTLPVATAQDNAIPVATIDAAKKGAPISPYIYGQFIEHLGRCIYGGIWAETLQDRKFYDAPGAQNSPWRLVGDAAFEMKKDGAFVGEASPSWSSENDSPFGVEQDGLAFVRGKKYVGYVWAQPSEKQQISVVVSVDSGRKVFDLPLETVETTAPDGYKKYAFEFVADGLASDVGEGTFAVLFKGAGQARLGTASLMPGDNVNGMRADTLAVLKDLDSPLYRWPGGNFVSGYNWKDGIGDRDRRPPRKNPAWQGIEHNDFGLDEFMRFCRYLGTEPYIAVNTGAGEIDSALEELEYANGAADSPQGKIRAANGNETPYGVKIWGIGNEMYGDWQIGHMPTDRYAEKNNRFVDAFRKFDPNLTLVAVGAVGAWDETIMRRCADHMDWISEHFYVQGVRGDEPSATIRHIEQVPNSIRRIADAHRKYRQEFPELAGKDIRIAMDEWNYWYDGPQLFGELGIRYFLKDGLGIAEGLHEYYRNSDIFAIANYAQTVNVIGCVKTSRTNAKLETTGLVLKLYRREFGEIPLAVDVPKPFDAVAATTKDGKTLTIAVVNPTGEAATIRFDAQGLALKDGGRKFEIVDRESDPTAFNDPDAPTRVEIVESAFEGDVAQGVRFAPFSATLLKIDLAE